MIRACIFENGKTLKSGKWKSGKLPFSKCAYRLKTHLLIYLHFKHEKHPSKKVVLGENICMGCENSVPLQCI